MNRRTPDDPLDAAARRAFRAACERVGGYAPYRDFFQLTERSAQRLYAMKAAVPPGIAAQLADALVAEPKLGSDRLALQHATDLRRWADHCRAGVSPVAATERELARSLDKFDDEFERVVGYRPSPGQQDG